MGDIDVMYMLALMWGLIAGMCITGFIYERCLSRIEDVVYSAITDLNVKKEE